MGRTNLQAALDLKLLSKHYVYYATLNYDDYNYFYPIEILTIEAGYSCVVSYEDFLLYHSENFRFVERGIGIVARELASGFLVLGRIGLK